MSTITSVTNVPSNVYISPVQRQNPAYAVALAQAANENALLNATGQTSSRDDSLFNVADILDLSPRAQSELNFYNTVSNANAGRVTTGDTVLNLTAEQQAEIDAILEKYQDAQFNSETYQNILADLAAAGLSPAQMAAQNSASSLSLSALLLNALSSDNSSQDLFNYFAPTAVNDNTAFTNYVITQWESVSTQYNAPIYATNTLVF